MQTGHTFKSRSGNVPIYHNSCFAMGTRLNVVVTDSMPYADELFGEIAEAVGRIEAKLSRFDERADVYAINQHAGCASVGIDAEMRDVLFMCMDYYRRTDGNFDITLPSKCDANKLSDCILVDAEKQTVAFRDAAVRIDLGGFGKGYALKEVESILRNQGVHNALVSFGESSILGMGHHPYGDCWKVGIENVTRPGQSAHIFELSDQSLSVSGFQRMPEGSPGFHIISPVTKQPVEKTSTVAVQSADPLEAEILSTAVCAAFDSNDVFIKNFIDCQVIRVDYTYNQLSEIYTYE